MSAVPNLRWCQNAANGDLYLPFQNAPIGLAHCRREGDIIALNPAWERMLGTLSNPPVRLSELTHPHDPATGERLLRELFQGERDSFQVDSESIHNGHQPLRWTAWRVPSGSGDDDYALALVEHIVDGGEAEQRLRQAQRFEAVGRLAGGVAHDFNNLLTGVLLYCDLLMASVEPGSRVRKYAEEIRTAGMQATGLVRQLLSVTRPSKPGARLLSLNEIVEGMRNLLLRLIGENIVLKFSLDPNLCLVKMDPTQAQQILLNLVLNARDAMPRGGQITVETGNGKVQLLPDDGISSAAVLPCALFVVADNGVGMDAGTRAHVFEAFFTTKGLKGTGLGLATVHDIVTSHGGLIYVDSAPFQGTRITVLLPRASDFSPGISQANAVQKIEGELPITAKE